MVAIAVLNDLLASLAQLVDAIEWTQYLSPCYYADVPRWLTEGPVWWHQATLLAGALVLFVLAVRGVRAPRGRRGRLAVPRRARTVAR